MLIEALTPVGSLAKRNSVVGPLSAMHESSRIGPSFHVPFQCLLSALATELPPTQPPTVKEPEYHGDDYDEQGEEQKIVVERFHLAT